MVKRFSRLCKKCNRKFVPTSKNHRVCYECNEETYKKKKKTNVQSPDIPVLKTRKKRSAILATIQNNIELEDDTSIVESDWYDYVKDLPLDYEHNKDARQIVNDDEFMGFLYKRNGLKPKSKTKSKVKKKRDGKNRKIRVN